MCRYEACVRFLSGEMDPSISVFHLNDIDLNTE